MTEERLPLAGLTVGITADRRADEQGDLLRKRGAEVLIGPAMRTIDVVDDEGLRAATKAVIDQEPGYVLTTTGYGIRLWLQTAETWGLRDDLLAVLRGARVAARGSKAASALRQAGIEPWWRSSTERMEEVVSHVAGRPLDGASVAMLLDGYDRTEHADVLTAAGARLISVPLYRWAFPEDTAPAQRLIRAAVAGDLAAITFTSQPAVHNVFRLADEAHRARDLREALNGPVLAVCVGPVCAEAAKEHGVQEPIWPEPARLAPMIRLLTDRLTAART